MDGVVTLNPHGKAEYHMGKSLGLTMQKSLNIQMLNIKMLYWSLSW